LPFTTVITNYTQSGESFPNWIRIYPLYDAENKITHFTGIMENVNSIVRSVKPVSLIHSHSFIQFPYAASNSPPHHRHDKHHLSPSQSSSESSHSLLPSVQSFNGNDLFEHGLLSRPPSTAENLSYFNPVSHYNRNVNNDMISPRSPAGAAVVNGNNSAISSISAAYRQGQLEKARRSISGGSQQLPNNFPPPTTTTLKPINSRSAASEDTLDGFLRAFSSSNPSSEQDLLHLDVENGGLSRIPSWTSPKTPGSAKYNSSTTQKLL
jgi:hypothetical protein